MKWKLSLIVTMVICSCSFAITKDELINKFATVDTSDAMESARACGLANIPVLEEILLMRPGKNVPREAALVILQEAAQTGRYPTDSFFNLLLNQAKEISAYSHPLDADHEKEVIIAELATFGNSLSLDISFSAFSSLANSMLQTGFFKNQGISNSLSQKISNAQKSFEKKGSAAKSSAVNQITAAINELNAQKGKGVTEDGFQILSGYCQSLINKIQNKNP